MTQSILHQIDWKVAQKDNAEDGIRTHAGRAHENALQKL